MIGWKDAREARRALQDSLPLIHEATRVTVEESTAQRQLHRINANSRVILHQQGSGSAELIKFAQEDGADIIVTGAYGHSRLGEWIFGGVTGLAWHELDLLPDVSLIVCKRPHERQTRGY